MHARYNPAETFGPKKPLVGPYTYRVKQNVNGDTLIAVYDGSKRVAHMDAFWAYSMKNIEDHEAEEAKRGKGNRLVCATDLRALGAEGKYPNVLSVSHAFIDDPDYKGKGIGRAMYQAMMVEGFAVRETRIGGSRGPMFFMPDECKGAGNTSADAKRVWASLAREYPSAGTSIRVDAPPVIGSRPAAAPAPVPVASPALKERPMTTSRMYDALHAAAGDALRAWMDAHHAAVERADRYREAIDNAADSIYVNVADTLKTDSTSFSSPEEAVRAHNGIAEELWGERLDRADRALYPFSQAWPFIYALALEAVPYAFENMRLGMRGAAPVREYRYGVENRPAHPGNVPQGYVRLDRALAHEPRTRWGVVVYHRPLTENEVWQYQLVPYMPLAEVVESVVARLSKYGEKYAADARKDGGVFKTAAASAFRDLNVYTDVPMEEMRERVAAELLRRFPAPEPATATAAVREYRYGARNRPPGYATVPSGYIRVDPPPFPQEARVRHGIVVYNRPLTDEEVRGYELHPYMPLAEVVDGVIASLGEYAEEAYAPNVREEGAEQVRSETGGYLDDHTVYTDVPLGEVYKHVAAELLRRFPEAPAAAAAPTVSERFAVRGMAASTLDAENDAAQADESDMGEEILAVVRAYRAGDRKALVVSLDNADLVVSGLTDLSNGEDAIAEEERKQPPARRDPERMKHARAASDGLTAISQRIATWQHEQTRKNPRRR